MDTAALTTILGILVGCFGTYWLGRASSRLDRIENAFLDIATLAANVDEHGRVLEKYEFRFLRLEGKDQPAHHE